MLNDCWFLTTIAAIAETPERIQKIFNNIDEYPTNGQFVFDFYAFS